jgi:hypothetical protein
MRKSPRIVSLAAALTALGAPVAAPPTADASDSDGDQLATKVGSGIQVETEIRLMDDGELMSFTVHRMSNGLMFPQHGSHSSHSSHSSHVSHASSSGGYGGGGYGVPNWPNPYVPPVYVPPPVYAPPPAAPPPAATPPPAGTADPIQHACTQASNGLGVNEIVSELGQFFGLPQNEAMNIATRALTSVLTGDDYCDAYLEDNY